MRVHHLNCGTFSPRGQLFINGHGSPFASGELVCHCLAIETSAGIVLVDTGLGTHDIAEPMESLPGPFWQAWGQAQLDIDETMVRQLELLGFKPEDVRNIILTHLDFDQAGGLADFPSATVHVLQTEYEAALHPKKWIEHERYSPRQLSHQPAWRLHEVDPDERWLGFDAVRPIPGLDPEILLVPLPGHSRGHCGVAIKDGPGWLFHAGDAFFHHSELKSENPGCPLFLKLYANIFQDDRALRLQSLECVRELAQNQEGIVRIVNTHDPDLLLLERAVEANRAYVS